MRLPIYKKVLITFPQKNLITAQLDQIDFGENPYIFEFSKQVTDHLTSIKIIEAYFLEHNINTHSYPLYIISDSLYRSNIINIVKSSEEAPKYFRHKSKQLSSKESAQLDLINLKQTQLENLQSENFTPAIESYGRQAKVVAKLQYEQNFYQALSKKLGI